MTTQEKTIYLRYYALLREERGLTQETIKTSARTLEELYTTLAVTHGFSLAPDILRVAVNDAFVSWEYILQDCDIVVFIPPVAGG